MTHKILVVGPSWVGDSVMAQPLYTRLHQHHTELNLQVLAPSWTLPLLERMPEVAKAHLNPLTHGMVALGKRWQLARQLAKEQFDQVIVLPNSFKSALIPYFARIPIRTGFVGEWRYGLLNDARELDERRLPMMVERFCALAEPNGQLPPHPIPHPKLTLNPAQQQQSLERLQLTAEKPIIALCPGAEYGPAKRWPTKHFAHLAKRFQQANYQVWLLGSPKDKEMATEIVQQSNHAAINLCGTTGLDEAIDLIGLSALVVCNDSGLMHIAAALNKPLIALYGSSSPDFTPPLSDKAHILSMNLDCSPCFERHCPYQHTNCLETLSPDKVWESALTILDSTS